LKKNGEDNHAPGPEDIFDPSMLDFSESIHPSAEGIIGLQSSSMEDEGTSNLKGMIILNPKHTKVEQKWHIELELNTGLHSLKLIPYDGFVHEPHQSSDMSKLLNGLKYNKTLIKLDLSKCETVVGKGVLGTIMDVLQVNFSLEELGLHGTPFECDGSDVIV
jgi:hypothetical protein